MAAPPAAADKHCDTRSARLVRVPGLPSTSMDLISLARSGALARAPSFFEAEESSLWCNNGGSSQSKAQGWGFHQLTLTSQSAKAKEKKKNPSLFRKNPPIRPYLLTAFFDMSKVSVLLSELYSGRKMYKNMRNSTDRVIP